MTSSGGTTHFTLQPTKGVSLQYAINNIFHDGDLPGSQGISWAMGGEPGSEL